MLKLAILLLWVFYLHCCFFILLLLCDLWSFGWLSLHGSGWSIRRIVRCLVKKTHKFFLLVLLDILWLNSYRPATWFEKFNYIRILGDCFLQTMVIQILIKSIIALTIGSWLGNKNRNIVNIKLYISIYTCSALYQFSLPNFSKNKYCHLLLSFLQFI